jgi:hypothetical protein
MKEFKFLTGDKRIYYEGREVVYVGYRIYNPRTFDAIRRIRLRDEGGRIEQEEIGETHPLWNELYGIEHYVSP